MTATDRTYFSGTLSDFGPCREVITLEEDGSNVSEVLDALERLQVLTGHSQNEFIIYTSLGQMQHGRFLVGDHKGSPRIVDTPPLHVVKEEWALGHMMGEGDRRYASRQEAAMDCDQGEYPVVRRVLSNGVIIDWRDR